MDIAPDFGLMTIDDFDLIPLAEWSLASYFNRLFNILFHSLGGYGGNWWKVWHVQKKIRQADWVLSQVDSVGIALVYLSALKLVPRRDTIYISIGLPERLSQMSPTIRDIFKWACRKTIRLVVCYGYKEHEMLSDFFRDTSVHVRFLPFGIDTTSLTEINTSAGAGEEYYVSVGNDPQRDYALLVELSKYLEQKIIVVSGSTDDALRSKPERIVCTNTMSFDSVVNLIKNAKAVLLPVRNNSYSGATTTLMLSLALGKVVCVTPTDAIKKGYNLINMKNCIFLDDDGPEFFRRLSSILSDQEIMNNISANAPHVAVDYRDTYRKLFSLISEYGQSEVRH
jgi:glycosyltransferase involved in cell wall biosynthesis